MPPVTFTLLPALDVADGRAVRVHHGDAGTASAHGDPRHIALSWQAAGAAWIHLVDLDAALGRGSNAELLATVIGELDVDVELSGGIRDDDSLDRALATGCTRVNLGTAALADPAWCGRVIAAHGARVAVSLDVRVVEVPTGSTEHRLVARGGTTDVGDLWETLEQLDRDGCARYVVTDVSRDGTLAGPAVDLSREVTLATPSPVIASGGVSSIGDLLALAELAVAHPNLEGCIVGNALHAGRFTLPEALAAARQADGAARVG